VTAPDIQPAWSRLLRVARNLICQANAVEIVIDRWTFGGGTAMMLQIDHRESHDIDIFLPDPQSLGFLDPAERDFVLDTPPTDYHGDGAAFLKLAFEHIGEIDFIVAGSLTSQPVTQSIVENESALLETIPEIIAKKIYHRGSSIRPRDIFDIAAAGETHTLSIIRELQPYRDEVSNAVSAMDRLNPEFVGHAIAQLAIKPGYDTIARTAHDQAKEIMRAVLS
jgi:hypothetical protein